MSLTNSRKEILMKQGIDYIGVGCGAVITTKDAINNYKKYIKNN